MRAKNEGKHGMGKRFAVVIGAAAAGVMALGAQTGAAAPDVVDTNVTLRLHDHERFIYWVGSKDRKCERGRRVVLFEVRPGADRKLGTARSKYRSGRSADAVIIAKDAGDDVVYAQVRREVHDEFVCGGDRSERHDDRVNR